MKKQPILIAALSLCFLLTIQTQAKSDDNVSAPTITVTKLEINDEALHLTYEIRNDSDDDAWILVGWYRFSDSTYGMGASIRIDEDGCTLTIGARLKGTTPGMGFQPLYGRLVRLCSGDSQTESIFMTIPAYTGLKFEHTEQREQATKYATRLAI